MSHNGASRVILVVEDEWMVRSLIADELRSAGWEVLETSTAEDALALLRSGHRIHVVFTDIQLAGEMCGWNLAEQFRAAQPDIPVVYTSGNSADRTRSVAGSVFFDKPYRAHEVVEACLRLS